VAFAPGRAALGFALAEALPLVLCVALALALRLGSELALAVADDETDVFAPCSTRSRSSRRCAVVFVAL